MGARIRKGDSVVVISGKDKGKTGKVTRVLVEDDRVVVEGINLVKRHTRPTPRNPSGRDHRARAADPRLKVMPVDPKTGKGTRVRFKDARGRQEGSHRSQERRGDPRGRRRSKRSWPTRRSRRGEQAKPGGEQGRRSSARAAARGARAARAARPSEAADVTTTVEAVPARLLDKYKQQVIPALTKQFSYKNPMQVPRLQKIVINMGLGAAVANPKIIDTAVEDLKAISGQKPVVTRSKKAIANFKLREGIPIGAMVTLRSARMWEFLDRLVTLALPRTRDFKGVSRKAFDGKGNYTLGLKEQIIFPEIDYDKIDAIKGLNISFVTTARHRRRGARPPAAARHAVPGGLTANEDRQGREQWRVLLSSRNSIAARSSPCDTATAARCAAARAATTASSSSAGFASGSSRSAGRSPA